MTRIYKSVDTAEFDPSNSDVAFHSVTKQSTCCMVTHIFQVQFQSWTSNVHH